MHVVEEKFERARETERASEGERKREDMVKAAEFCKYAGSSISAALFQGWLKSDHGRWFTKPLGSY